MPVNTEQDNRLLQYTAATYEYRNADTGNGASAGRRTEAVLEKQLCAVPQHLNRTNQSGSNTVNQNSDSVKTFRDKKHRL